METIKHKDFIGSVEVSMKDNCIYGKILFINDLVTYQTDNIDKIKGEFEAAVDDYIKTCKELDIEPHKSFSGTFNVRIGVDLHQKTALFAARKDININKVVTNALENYLDDSIMAQEVHNHTINISIEEPSEKLICDNNDLEAKNNIVSFSNLTAVQEG